MTFLKLQLSRHKVWLSIILFLLLFVSFIVLPKIHRAYTIYNSSQLLPINNVIGKWVQYRSGNEEGDYQPLISAFITFDNNGTYYLRYTCTDSGSFQENSGDWFYYSKPHYFLGFVPLGYQNWIKLDFDHDTDPQFYIKTDKGGRILMYRAFGSVCISEKIPFSRL
jgi:hypothetical protein